MERLAPIPVQHRCRKPAPTRRPHHPAPPATGWRQIGPSSHKDTRREGCQSSRRTRTAADGTNSPLSNCVLFLPSVPALRGSWVGADLGYAHRHGDLLHGVDRAAVDGRVVLGQRIHQLRQPARPAVLTTHRAGTGRVISTGLDTPGLGLGGVLWYLRKKKNSFAYLVVILVQRTHGRSLDECGSRPVREALSQIDSALLARQWCEFLPHCRGLKTKGMGARLGNGDRLTAGLRMPTFTIGKQPYTVILDRG